MWRDGCGDAAERHKPPRGGHAENADPRDHDPVLIGFAPGYGFAAKGTP